jgi:methylmalonyl-CoA/ethylmalonyl-CoA epimerase
MEKMPNEIVIQVGIVVKDAARVVKNLADVFGTEEVPAVKKGEKNNPNYRTTYGGHYAADTEWIGAVVKMGQVDLEIIQPCGEGPSIWQDFLDQHGEGLHHLAWKVKDTGEVIKLLQTKGMGVPQHGSFKNGTYTYFNSEEKLGFIIEALEFFNA